MGKLKVTIFAIALLAIVILVTLLAMEKDSHYIPKKKSFRKVLGPVVTARPTLWSAFANKEERIALSKACLPKFQNVLLVIVYHYNTYETIPLLQRYYELAFPNIVYCGPEEYKRYDLIKVDIVKGFYAYECLGEAIRRNPNFTGYFYINDDTLVNWWVVHKYNTSKVWTSLDDMKVHDGVDMTKGKPSDGWSWWEFDNTLGRCKAAVEQVATISKSETSSNTSYVLSPNTMKIYYKNTEGVKLCGKAASDVFYVPATAKDIYSNISRIFFNNKVFLEAGVPTILRFLDDHDNFQSLDGFYLRYKYGSIGFHDGVRFWENYRTWVSFFHPVKLSKTSLNRNLFLDLIYNFGVEKLRNCRSLRLNTTAKS